MKAMMEMHTHTELERELMQRGYGRIAGVDEAGRGPLAGPVVAAAVVFAPDTEIEGIADSKALRENRRNELAVLIKKHALAWATASASPGEIDTINILQASLLAMRRAVDKLTIRPDFLLIDGKYVFSHSIATRAVLRGDSLCFSIAAASILAKTERDSIMIELDKEYPEYGFARHKGYPTKLHATALLAHGPSPYHRRSFTLKSTE